MASQKSKWQKMHLNQQRFALCPFDSFSGIQECAKRLCATPLIVHLIPSKHKTFLQKAKNHKKKLILKNKLFCSKTSPFENGKHFITWQPFCFCLLLSICVNNGSIFEKGKLRNSIEVRFIWSYRSFDCTTQALCLHNIRILIAQH